MAWKRYRVGQPVSSRQPNEKSLLKVVQKELWPFFQQVRDVLNWAAEWVGLAQVDVTDTPGTLQDKTLAGTGVTITVIGPDGGRQLLFSANATDITNIVTTNITNIVNQASSPTDPVTGSPQTIFYPANVPDPNNHGMVACCFLGPHTKLANTPMLVGFNEISPGVFENQVAGPMPADWFDGVTLINSSVPGSVSSMIGKTVIAYYQGDTSVGGYEEPLQQLLVIDDPGGHWESSIGNNGNPYWHFVSTKLRMHRAPNYSFSSQYVQNMTFQVQSGNLYGTGFLRLTNASVVLGTTALTWTFTAGPTYAWTDKYELLLGGQLGSEGASNATLELSATATAGDALLHNFVTLIGTPALGAIPAGIWKADNEEVYLDAPGSPGSVTTLRWLVMNPTGPTTIFTMESAPLSNTTPMPLQFQYNDSGHAFSPTDELEVGAWLHTTSTTPVTLHLRYNSAIRGTRITAPFGLSSPQGVTHPALSGRSVADQHPVTSITPIVESNTGSGWLTLANGSPAGARSSCVRWTASGSTLDGIDKLWSDGTAIPDFFEVCVFIVNASTGNPITINHNSTPSGTKLPFSMALNAGDDFSMNVSQPTELVFRLDLPANVWRLRTFVSYP